MIYLSVTDRVVTAMLFAAVVCTTITGCAAIEAAQRISAGQSPSQPRYSHMEEVESWYREDAEQGDAIAMYNLGRALRSHWMIDYKNPFNPFQTGSIRYLPRVHTPSREDPTANVQYAMVYAFKDGAAHRDAERVRHHDEESIKWLRKSAEAGHVPAMYQLGISFATGRDGVLRTGTGEDSNRHRVRPTRGVHSVFLTDDPRFGDELNQRTHLPDNLNTVDAARWLGKAAVKDHRPSAYILTELLRRDNLSRSDTEMIVGHLRKAAAGTNPVAKRWIARSKSGEMGANVEPRQPAMSQDAFSPDKPAIYAGEDLVGDPWASATDADAGDWKWGVLGDAPSPESSRPMVLSSAQRIQLGSPRNESEQAIGLAAQAIVDRLPNLYHAERREVLGIQDAQGRYVLRMGIEPESMTFHASEIPVADHMRNEGVRAIYHVNVVDGLSFEAKPWNEGLRSAAGQSFPSLFPWVTGIRYAQIFRPIEVVFYREREPLVRSPFDSVQPVDQMELAKLYNLPQDSFLDAGNRLALQDVRRLLAGSFHTIGSSLFICRTGGLPGGSTAHFARSANHAMAWDSPYAQSTRVIVREVVGRSQVWIDEGEVSQVDRVNGIRARGTARIRARGFSRTASVSVETEYLRRENLTVRPHDPWSSWQAPATYAMDWEYTVAENGAVTWIDGTGGPRDPSLYGHGSLLGPLGEPTQRFAVSRAHLNHFLELTGYRPVELPPEKADDSLMRGLIER